VLAFKFHFYSPPLGRDSSVCIVTCYGMMDGPGIESLWEARFSAPVQTGPGAHPATYTMGTGSLLGVKWPGRGVDHPPPSSAEVKERVELYIYSTLWVFVCSVCSGVNFIFTRLTLPHTHNQLKWLVGG